MQAAIGLHQLEKVDAWIATRNGNARLLASWLGDYPCVSLCRLPEGFAEAHYRFAFRVDPHRLKPGWNRDRIMKALIAEGVPCFSGPCPELYLERAYAAQTRRLPRRPNAAYLGKVSLALHVHPALDPVFLNDARAAIRKVFDAAASTSMQPNALTAGQALSA